MSAIRPNLLVDEGPRTQLDHRETKDLVDLVAEAHSGESGIPAGPAAASASLTGHSDGLGSIGIRRSHSEFSVHANRTPVARG